MTSVLNRSDLGRAEHPDNVFSWLSAIVITAFLFAPLFGIEFRVDIVSLSILFNGLFGISMLWVSMADAPYSLRQVHWVFYITFFSAAPLFQYTAGIWPWGYVPTDETVLRTCVLVFIWGFIFASLSGRSRFISQQYDGKNLRFLEKKQVFTLAPLARLLLPLGCIVCFLLLLAVVGLDGMLFRTSNKVDLESSSLSMILTVCTRAFVFGSFALLWLDARHRHGHYTGMIVAGICLLLTCFPTSMARFNVAAVYLGLAVFACPMFSKKRGLFAFVLIMGFLVAYPLFNAFKYIGDAASPAEMFEIITDSITAGYTSGNYDAFSVMFWCFDYVDKFGLTYGSQLLGSLLFFIPRSIWPSKPVPSGELVFSSLQFHFTDIAFPLPFEGYLNFGFLGTILFAFIYGMVVNKVDARYWLSRMDSKAVVPTILMLYYPFLLCLTFYMLRGAMMTTLTYVIGDLVVMILLVKLATFCQRRSADRELKELDQIRQMNIARQDNLNHLEFLVDKDEA